MAFRSFTVAQANAMIPDLERLFDRFDSIRARLDASHERYQLLEVLWGDRLYEPATPDAGEASALQEEIHRGIGEIRRLIHADIVEQGLRFPAGGLEVGLVDFPTTWQARWVLLCWQRGEPALHAWHELDGGYAGRREITPEQERGMGTETPPDSVDLGLPFDP